VLKNSIVLVCALRAWDTRAPLSV